MQAERTTREALSYRFRRLLTAKFRSRKIPEAASLADELALKLLDEVPEAAFDPIDPFDRGVISFSGPVTEDWARDVSHVLRSAHLTLSGKSPLRLILNSPGGYVYDGLMIVSTIQEIQRDGRDVDVHVAGCAMSMGSVILQAGTRRTIDAHGFILLHELAYGMSHEKTSGHVDALEEAKALQRAVFALYSARTGKPVDYYLKRFDRRDWTLTAREALEERLVDEIIAPPTYRAGRRRAS